MLALRRIGPNRLERYFGAGDVDKTEWASRSAVVPAEWVQEIQDAADRWAATLDAELTARIGARRLRACIGTTDVHEHGKHLVERGLAKLGVVAIDGGVSADPERLVGIAADARRGFHRHRHL